MQRPSRDDAPAPADDPPAQGVPLLVFFSPDVYDDLTDEAAYAREEVATLVRRAVRRDLAALRAARTSGGMR